MESAYFGCRKRRFRLNKGQIGQDTSRNLPIGEQTVQGEDKEEGLGGGTQREKERACRTEATFYNSITLLVTSSSI